MDTATSQVPSLREFIDETKPLNPGYTDEEIAQVYTKAYGAPAPIAPQTPLPATPTALPTFEEFRTETKPLNPGYTDDQIKQVWQQAYGSRGAAEREPTFLEGVTSGLKQGAYAVGSSAAGTMERLSTPASQAEETFAHAGQELERAAQHYAPSADLASQPWYQRLSKPGYLGNLIGNIAVQTAPSVAAAVAGGAVGGPPGAAAAMAGMIYFQQAGDSYRQAVQRYRADGMSEVEAHQKAYEVSGLAGLVSGVVNSLAVPASIVAPFTKKLTNLALQYALNVGVDTADQLTQNLVAKQTYAPETELTAGLPETIVGSALLSAPETMTAVKATAPTSLGKVASGPSVPRERVDEPVTPPPQTERGSAPAAPGPTERILAAPSTDAAIAEAAKALQEPVVTPEAMDRTIAMQHGQAAPPTQTMAPAPGIVPSSEALTPAAPAAAARAAITEIPPIRPAETEEAPATPPVRAQTPVDEAAHAAATSPTNARPEPTEAQIEAGNYQKGHVQIAGLDISIENPQGSERSGVRTDGTPWSVVMASHYGYLLGTKGKDKEHLDVFIKPGTPMDYAGPVFVVNQQDPTTKTFDEHKVVLGAATAAEARRLYLANYQPGWQGLRSIVRFSLPQFKAWLESGDHTKPARPVPRGTAEAMPNAPVTGEVGKEIDNLSPADLQRLRQRVALRFQGIQKGRGPVADFELWTLHSDYPGLQKGSTYSRQTLEQAGLTVPPAPLMPSQPSAPAGVPAVPPSGPPESGAVIPRAPEPGTALHPTVHAYITAQPETMRPYFEQKAQGFVPDALIAMGDKRMPVKVLEWMDRTTALIETPAREVQTLTQAPARLIRLPGSRGVPKYQSAPHAAETNPAVTRPRSNLPEAQNQNLADRATIADSMLAAGEPGTRIFAEHRQGPGQTVTGIPSTYPTWYGPLKMKKATVLKALEKIKEEQGVDVGPTVERVKAALLSDRDLDRIVGEFPGLAEELSKEEYGTPYAQIRGKNPGQTGMFGEEPLPEKPVPTATPKQAALPMEVPVESGQRPIVGREATREEAPLFSKQAQTAEPVQTAIATALRTAADAIEQAGTPKEKPVEVKPEAPAVSPPFLQPSGPVEQAPTFFSQAERVLQQKMPNRASAAQIRGLLSPANGVKPDEIKWIGLDDYLKTKESFTKDEVLAYVRANQVEIREVTLADTGKFGGQTPDQLLESAAREERIAQQWQRNGDEQQAQRHFARAEAMTRAAEGLNEETGSTIGMPKFAQYQLPGGTNYRELLLTLPITDPSLKLPFGYRLEQRSDGKWVVWAEHGQAGYDYLAGDTREDAIARFKQDRERIGAAPSHIPAAGFVSSHFSEPNVLAHVRFNDRVSADGKKVLFLEEIQSDWHQKGRKSGYQETSVSRSEILRRQRDIFERYDRGEMTTEERNRELDALDHDKSKLLGVPDAPFKKTWQELVLRRMLRYAAEHGYDTLAWTTGAQQAERYDLSKQVDRLIWQEHDGLYDLSATRGSETIPIKEDVPEANLADYVGKDAAGKIVETERRRKAGQTTRTFIEGDDLKVGGEGMTGFYDRIVPAYLNRYAKKWGAQVGTIEIATADATGRRLSVEQFGHGERPFRLVDGTGRQFGDFMYATREEAEVERARLEPGMITVHALPITPAMRASVLTEGQPFFQLHPSQAMARLRARLHGAQVSPFKRESAKLTIKKGLRNLEAETLTSRQFVSRMEHLYDTLDLARQEPSGGAQPNRVRGPNFIRERLTQAVQRGDIPRAQMELAEWFLHGNEHLFEALGISVRQPAPGQSGSYNALSRIMTLAKGNEKTDTAVHEMLHHLERLMPQEYQQAIRQEWARQITQAYASAEAATVKQYLEAVLLANATNKTQDWQKAYDFVNRGEVPYAMYHLMNPSEWWAVNGAGLLQARHTGVWGRIRQWLREAVERIKYVLGLPSDTPILHALSWLQAKSTGEERSPRMLAEAQTSAGDSDRLEFMAPDRGPGSSESAQTPPEPGRDWRDTSREALEAARQPPRNARLPFSSLNIDNISKAILALKERKIHSATFSDIVAANLPLPPEDQQGSTMAGDVYIGTIKDNLSSYFGDYLNGLGIPVIDPDGVPARWAKAKPRDNYEIELDREGAYRIGLPGSMSVLVVRAQSKDEAWNKFSAMYDGRPMTFGDGMSGGAVNLDSHLMHRQPELYDVIISEFRKDPTRVLQWLRKDLEGRREEEKASLWFLDQAMQDAARLAKEETPEGRRAKFQLIHGSASRPNPSGPPASGPSFAQASGPEASVPPRGADRLGPLTEAQETALRHIHGSPQTWTARLQAFRATWPQTLIQGLFDQYAPILDYTKKGYLLSRLTKGGDGTMEALLLYGKPYVDADGAYRVEYSKETGMNGFAKVLASLQGEWDRFLEWVAAQRAERLKGIGLEHLYRDEDIAALKTLNQGKLQDGSSRPEAYAKALSQLNEWNAAMVKIAVDSKLIGPEVAQLYRDTPYVPFYRLQDEGVVSDFGMKAGLVNQYAWKKLKGGTEHLNDDLLVNLLQNWSHILTASAKNRAAKETLDAAVTAGVAHEVPAGTPGKGLVGFRDDVTKSIPEGQHYEEGGQTKVSDGTAQITYNAELVFRIDDPALLDAVAAMHYAGLGSIGKPFITAKRYLTGGVTVNPAFKIRNLIKDAIQAMGTAELSYNPFKNIAQGWKATALESETRAQLLAGGGMIRFGTMLDGNNADRTRRLIEQQGVDPAAILDDAGKIRRMWRHRILPAFEAYQEYGDRGEQVSRAALYEQLRAKGMSHLEASFWARDLMDFSLTGKWEAVRILSQVVPFMNARLQGLYKIGRATKTDYRRMGTTLGAVALSSIALLLAYQDDDDWKKREDWDRDNYWWFKIWGMAVRVPKPFEIGAMATVAERGVEYLLSDEMTGRRLGTRLSAIVFNQLSMNPTPQLVKPLMDLYANKDAFTGRPIETLGMERLRKEDRATERTSEVAKVLGSLGLPDPTQLAMGQWNTLSPVQVDALIRGYFAWVGVAATTILDYGLRPWMNRGERPNLRLRDVFLAGNFLESLPTGSSRYVTDLYDQARNIEQAYGSYRDALKRGDRSQAKAIYREEQEKIRQYPRVEAIKRQEIALNAQIRRIEASLTLSGEEKRRRIDDLQERKHRLAQRFAMH